MRVESLEERRLLALVASDSFLIGNVPANGEYLADTPLDQNNAPQDPSVFGFAGPWNNGNTGLWRSISTPAGLDSPNLAGEAGGSVQFSFATEVGERDVRRNLANPPTVSTNDVFWFSGLVRYNGGDPGFDGYAYAGFAENLDNADTQGIRFGVEGDGTEMDLVIRQRDSGSSSETVSILDGIAAGQTYHVLVRGSVNTDLQGAANGNDNFRVWIDPVDVSSEAALGTPDAELENFAFFSDNAFDYLVFEGADIQDPGVQFDELNLGEQLADVAVPAGTVIVTDDDFDTTENVVLNVSTPGVLANDDTQAESLVADSGMTSLGASYSLAADGSFSYDPTSATALFLQPGTMVVDSFTYSLTDGSMGTVTLNVSGTTGPVDDSFSTTNASVLNVDAPGLLANDVGVATRTYVDAVNASDPMIHWRLDEADKSSGLAAVNSAAGPSSVGASGDGTYFDSVGDVADSPIAGTDSAASFGTTTASGSTGDRVQVDFGPIATPFPGNQLSLEIWLRSNSSANQMAIVSSDAPGGNNNESLLFLNGNDLNYYVNGNAVATGVTRGDIIDGEWHHLVVTYDEAGGADNLRTYLDGNVNLATSTGTVPDNGIFVLAQESDEPGGLFVDSQKFIGDLDEFALYDRVLPDFEVNAHLEAAPVAMTSFTPIAQVEGTSLSGSATFTSGQGASVTVNDDGSFSYDPLASTSLQMLSVGNSVSDSFTYTIPDTEGGQSETVTVTLNITSVAAALDDTATTDEETTISAAAPGVTANDRGFEYVSQVQDSDPTFYWRLGEADKTDGQTAVNLAAGPSSIGTAGDGTYRGAVGNVTDAALPNSTDPAANFGTTTATGSTGDRVVESAFAGTFPSTEITVESWVRGTVADNQDPTLFSYATSGGSNEFLFISQNDTWRIFIDNDARDTGVPESAILDGQWHHVAITRDSASGTSRLFIDGSLVNTQTNHQQGNPLLDSGSFAIAQEQDSADGGFADSQKFVGDLDEVAVYNRSLTSLEVQAHFLSAPELAGQVTDFQATSDQGATVVVNADGSYSYDPSSSPTLNALAASDQATDTFTYTATTGDNRVVAFSFPVEHGAGVESGASFSPDVTNLGVTVSPIEDTAGNVTVEVVSFANTGSSPVLRIDPDGNSVDLTQALANDKYVEFTVTPDASQPLNLDRLQLVAARSGGSEPRGFAIFSSADGFTLGSEIGSVDNIPSVRGAFTPYQFDLTAAQFQNLNSPLTFRIYGFSPADNNGVEFDDLTLFSAESAVDTATVSVTVTGVNDAPTPVGDTGATNEEGPVIDINLTGNDTDPDNGDTVTLQAIDTTGTLGSVSINPDNMSVSYDPAGQFNELAPGDTIFDSFSYTVTDTNGATATASVLVTITGENDPPIAVDDTATVSEDGPPVSIDPAANDTDTDSGATNSYVPFDIDTFNTAAGFNLVGTANVTGGVLQLTSNANSQQGSAWTNDPINLAGGFTADFNIGLPNILQPDGRGADGMSFSVQTVGNGINVGEAGPANNNLTISFDSFQNGGEPSASFIQVFADGASLAQQDLSFDLSGTDDIDVLIDYTPGDLDVTINGTPIITDLNVDLGAIGAIDESGEAFIGFGARTGGAAEEHNVNSFMLTAVQVTDADTVAVVDNQFSDFSTATGLQLNGDATINGTNLELAQNQNNEQGSAFFDTAQPVIDGFATSFRFEFAQPGGAGADGMFFTVHNDAAGAGFTGTQSGPNGNALTIEIDSHNNGAGAGDPSAANIKVRSNTSVGGIIATVDLNTAPFNIGDLSGSGEHTIEISYNGALLDITFDGVQIIDDLAVDLTSLGAVDANGDAFVGLGGRTGGLNEISRIYQWDFSTTTTETLPSGAIITRNADGTIDYDPNGQFESLSVGDTATDSFTYTLTDSNGLTDTGTITVTIDGENDPVTNVDAGGLYPISEGDSLTLTGSFDDVDANDSYTFSWDINGDGTFGDADGMNPTTLTFAQLQALGIDDGPATFDVSFQVDDGSGPVTSATPATLTLNNAPPVADVDGPDTGVLGLPIDFTFTATDPSMDDQAADFTFEVDWGDGTSETIVDSSPLTVSHEFQNFGEQTIMLTATDKDGGESVVATHVIDIVPVAVVDDDLVATGTPASDRIIFYPSNGGVKVRYNNITYPTDGTSFSFGGDLIANGEAGSDQIIVSSGLNIPAQFNGDEGNDYLAGGIADDTMTGGDGNDVILAGEGDNYVDGGDGSDRIEGRSGDDVIFGGTGNDRLNGRDGDDVLDGGDGNDFLFGGLGNDLLAGRAGADTINGSFGNDVILGGSESDQIFGGSDQDLLIGGTGADRLRGDAGDDDLIGGTTDLDDDIEAALDAMMASLGTDLATADPNVDQQVGEWFTSGSDRDDFAPFASDGAIDELIGGSGVDQFHAGSDSIRDFRSGESQFDDSGNTTP